jgi:N-acetylglucosaminyl-diphospho-decaprenol L-rhamnosyltransferase
MANRECYQLSLLTAYRARPSHLEILLDWLDRVRREEGFVAFELILVEGSSHPSALTACRHHDWVTYRFVEMPDAFNKARLLNRAASVARGAFVMPFDVDLLPARGVLLKHISLAVRSPACLLSGFRLQLPHIPDPGAGALRKEVWRELDRADSGLVCDEDRYPGLLVGRLLDGRRFGVCPCFPAEKFLVVGGYHEGYVGWGDEDQDLVERVCQVGLSLVRCYDLLYLHMPHPTDEAGWREERLTSANRALYRSRRKEWAADCHA